MKIRSTVNNLIIVGRPEPGEYQGNKTFKLNVLAEDSAGDIKCSEEAFISACSMTSPFTPVRAELLYNDTYKTVQITRIFPETPNVAPKPAPAGK